MSQKFKAGLYVGIALTLSAVGAQLASAAAAPEAPAWGSPEWQKSDAGRYEILASLIMQGSSDDQRLQQLQRLIPKYHAAGFNAWNHSPSRGRTSDSLLWIAIENGLPEVQAQLIALGAKLSAYEIEDLKIKDLRGVWHGEYQDAVLGTKLAPETLALLHAAAASK